MIEIHEHHGSLPPEEQICIIIIIIMHDYYKIISSGISRPISHGNRNKRWIYKHKTYLRKLSAVSVIMDGINFGKL